MKFSSRYAIAISLALLPLVAWLGAGTVEQEQDEACVYCDATRHLTEYHWYVWTLGGSKVLKDEIEPSAVMRDFPSFRCAHRWSCVSSRNIQGLDGPLWKVRRVAPPAFSIDCLGCFPTPERYNEDELFRILLNEAIDEEVATREQAARWLELGGVNCPEGPKPDEDEATVFGKLDALANDPVERSHPSFESPLLRDLPPPVSPPEYP